MSWRSRAIQVNDTEEKPQEAQPVAQTPSWKTRAVSVDDQQAQQSPQLIGENDLGSAELPFGVRSKLGFASNIEGKKDVIRKKYPGVEFANLPGEKPGEIGEMVVKLPGASRYIRIDDPSFTMTDFADFVGDVPSMGLGIGAGLLTAPTGPGAFAAAAAGGALGEVARKTIGRGLLGIEENPNLKDDVIDTGKAALFQLGGQAANKYILSPAFKYGAQKLGGLFSKGTTEAMEQASKELAGDVPTPSIPTPTIPGASPKVGVPAQELIPDFKTQGILKGETINTLDDVAKWAKQAPYMGDAGEMLSSEHLETILKRNPDLAQKFPNMYRQLAKSQTEKDVVGLMEQLPNKMKDNLIRLKDNTERSLKSTFDDVVKTTKADLQSTKGDIGRKALDKVKNTYDTVQKEAGPLFDRIKNTKFPFQQHVPQLRNKIVYALSNSDAYEDWAKYINLDKSGKLILAPKNQITNITGKEYGIIKDMIGKLNNKQITFSELQAMRANLFNNLDDANPRNTRKLSVVRDAIFEHMKELGDKKLPQGYVKDTFKKWAMNEKYIDDAQKLLGGKLSNVPQEEVLDRVFKNSVTVRDARNILGQKDFDDIAGNYLNQIVEKSIDRSTGRIQAGALDRALASKKDVLIEAIGIERTQKLLDTAALMRVMKYVPNPSGTGQAVATSKLLGDKDALDVILNPLSIPKDMAKGLLNRQVQRNAENKAIQEVEGLLGKKAVKNKGILTRAKDKVINEKTKAGAKRIVGNSGILLKPESNND